MSDTGERIRNRRKQLNISADALAEHLGVSRSTIFRYENGNIEKIPARILPDIAKFLQTSEAYLMGWNNSALPNTCVPPSEKVYPLAHSPIPFLEGMVNGSPKYRTMDHEAYPRSEIAITADFFMKAPDDSMKNARIRGGDIIFIKEQDRAENGEIAAVALENSSSMALRRFYWYGSKELLILKPENPDFEDLLFQGDEKSKVRILGIAVAFQSSLAQ